MPNPSPSWRHRLWFAQQSIKVFKFTYSLTIKKVELQKTILQIKTISFTVRLIRSHVLTILHVDTDCMGNQPFQTTLYFGKSQ